MWVGTWQVFPPVVEPLKVYAVAPTGENPEIAAFDGGRITSDAGALLLREVDARFGFLDRFAACFTDHRDADRVEHPVVDLLR